MNAGLYIRVSTEHQVKEGYSIEAQKRSLKKFAKNQNWNIFDIYADEGISGKNIENRPEVKRLINDIKTKKIDVVLLYKFDRLTRDSRDTENIIELIQQFGIEVFTISGGNIDVSTATGRFTVRINGAVAQLEREQTIERVKFAFEQKVKEGYTLASRTTCYGYDRKKHEKEMTINKEEAFIVKKIFKMYVEGKNFTQIANFLNLEKVPTKLSKIKEKKQKTIRKDMINIIWMPKTIKLILTNPTYIGKVRYHIGKKDGFITEGKHKPIIPITLWNDVQNRIKKTKKISKTCIPKEDVYYCGTLICGICGHKLTTSRTTRRKKDGSKVIYKSYRCVNREKKLCTCLGISHKKVEKAFLEYMDNIEELTGIEKVKITPDDDDNIKELESLKKSLQQTTTKKKQIMDLFMINELTHEQLKYMTKELDKKIEALSSEIERLKRITMPKDEVDRSKIAKTIKEHWLYLSNKEKLEFLTNFVEKIVIINRDKNKVNGNAEIIEVKFYNE